MHPVLHVPVRIKSKQWKQLIDSGLLQDESAIHPMIRKPPELMNNDSDEDFVPIEKTYRETVMKELPSDSEIVPKKLHRRIQTVCSKSDDSNSHNHRQNATTSAQPKKKYVRYNNFKELSKTGKRRLLGRRNLRRKSKRKKRNTPKSIVKPSAKASVKPSAKPSAKPIAEVEKLNAKIKPNLTKPRKKPFKSKLEKIDETEEETLNDSDQIAIETPLYDSSCSDTAEVLFKAIDIKSLHLGDRTFAAFSAESNVQEVQDSNAQNTEVQNTKAQDTAVQNREAQDTAVQDTELQDTEVQGVNYSKVPAEKEELAPKLLLPVNLPELHLFDFHQLPLYNLTHE